MLASVAAAAGKARRVELEHEPLARGLAGFKQRCRSVGGDSRQAARERKSSDEEGEVAERFRGTKERAQRHGRLTDQGHS